MKGLPRFVLVAVLSTAGLPSWATHSWSAALTKRGIDPSLVENPNAITPEVKAAAEALSGRRGGSVEELKRIQRALFDTERFTVDYESGATATAAEALATRRGNCVSFTNLFIAMARSRGYRVRAGYIQSRVVGERRGDLVYPLNDRYVVFDFYETREDTAQHIRLLDDFEPAALHVNNLAVAALSVSD